MKFPNIFNRKSKNTQALPDLEWYYDAEKRERSGLAWILALLSVIGIALVFIGLIFGGRWVYRKINKNNTNTVAVQTDTSKKVDNSGNSENKTEASTPTTDLTHNGSNTLAPSANTNATATAPTASTTKLSNTGPENTVAIFLAVTLFGTLIYRFKLVRN